MSFTCQSAVPTAAFLRAMEDHARSNLGIEPSEPLRATWGQMSDTFNEAIDSAADPNGVSRWRVLQSATGTGKTKGLALYCSMLVAANDRAAEKNGVLIVVRLTRQADDLAAEIRGHIGQLDVHGDLNSRCVAVHSASTCGSTIEAARQADVLIITHEAYKRALRRPERWAEISSWRHPYVQSGNAVKRTLNVIDEALDLMDLTTVHERDVRQVLSIVPVSIREAYPGQIAALEHLQLLFREIQRCPQKTSGLVLNGPAPAEASEVSSETSLSLPPSCSMGPVIDALMALDVSELTWTTASPKEATANRNRATSTLETIESLLGSWAFWTQQGQDQRLSFAALSVPPGLVSPVILDATARHNAVLGLLAGDVDVRPASSGARRYGNVTIRVARPGPVGKHEMRKNTDQKARLLFESLGTELRDGARVLIVSHKDVRASLKGRSLPGVSELVLCHYGEVDGRNDWQDFDTVVLFGLSFRPEEWAIGAAIAASDEPEQGVLERGTVLSATGFDDVKSALVEGAVAVTIIQSINRVRCRRAIDGDGNCEPVDVFLTLPRGALGNRLITSVLEDMPGSKRGAPWNLRFAASDGSSSGRLQVAHGVVSWALDQPVGSYAARMIKRDLALTDIEWGNFLTDEGRHGSAVQCLVAHAGLTIERGRGRNANTRVFRP